MKIIRDHHFIAPHLKGASAAIGNFDGVHLGHQHVLDLARRHTAPLGVVTFEPHPRQVFSPDGAPFRLMNAAARARRLEKLGVERLYELNFNPAMAALDAETFAGEVLAGGLGLRHVVVGGDFRFGRNRGGDAAALRVYGARHGFEVTIADPMQTDGQSVSSTAIRNALCQGRPEKAAAMLGHWHRIEGPVVHGEKRGRTLGYPTANMELTGLHLPVFGVYAVLVDIEDGAYKGRYRGVASLGVRPMFKRQVPNLETHIFDFKGDLYGAYVSVGLVAWLRPEATFGDIEALKAQMDADSAKARARLSDGATTPLRARHLNAP